MNRESGHFCPTHKWKMVLPGTPEAETCACAWDEQRRDEGRAALRRALDK